jgi:hypothetical protein
MSAYARNGWTGALRNGEGEYRPASAAIVVWYAFDFVRSAGGTWAAAAAGSMDGMVSRGRTGRVGVVVGGVGRRRRWERRRREGW